MIFSSKRILFFLIAFFVVIFLIIGGFFYFSSRTYSYDIPGVPYLGVYNVPTHEYIYDDVAAVIYEVSAYWHSLDSSLPLFDFTELSKKFPGYREKGWSFGELENFFKENGYITEYHHPSSMEDFKEFISSGRRTPLIIYQRLENNTAFASSFRPYRLLTGISFSENKVRVYDFYLGANYEMSFEKFKSLWWDWGETNSDKDVRGFLAVYPKNYKEIIAKSGKMNLSSPERTKEMEFAAPLLIEFFKAKAFDIPFFSTSTTSLIVDNARVEDAIKKWESLVANPNFNTLMPIFKSFIYNGLSRDYLLIGDLSKAKDAGEKTVEFANGLPDGVNCGWLPGGTGNEVSFMQKQLADVYFAMGDKNRASNLYKDALKKEPANKALNLEIDRIINQYGL